MNCEWCGVDAGQKATCGSPHRGARWRFLKGIGDDVPPWPGSPLHGRHGEGAEGASERARAERAAEEARAAAVAAAERAAALERQQAAEHPRSGARARSGVTLSYRKAVAAAQKAFAGYVMASGCSKADADEEIEQVLRGALTDVQRAKLNA